MLYASSHDLADAKNRLWRILDRGARADVPELLRLGRTLVACSDELLAYWTRPDDAASATARPRPPTP